MTTQLQTRLASAVVQFVAGTNFRWAGRGILSIVRTGAGVYVITLEFPRTPPDFQIKVTPISAAVGTAFNANWQSGGGGATITVNLATFAGVASDAGGFYFSMYPVEGYGAFQTTTP